MSRGSCILSLFIWVYFFFVRSHARKTVAHSPVCRGFSCTGQLLLEIRQYLHESQCKERQALRIVVYVCIKISAVVLVVAYKIIGQ
jgi:hypothetical protein